ncbi:MAG: cytochrome c [Phycisphaerae bacterium]|nr:cytochrome c [Phycisphaerae bacterium]MDW8263251.1 cytochrome c [Phycisphaerales bacterium]
MSAGATQPESRYVQGPGGLLEDFRLHRFPKWAFYVAVVGVIASWVPLALIFRARFATTDSPRIHIFQDMDNQPRFRPQARNTLFADGRAMRPAIPGTVARGRLNEDDHFTFGYRMVSLEGKRVPEFFHGYPASVQAILDQPETARAFLLRGRDRYNIYCAACHGQDGHGAGPIHVRADLLTRNGVEGMSWVQPKNLHEEAIRAREDGHIFNTITNGIRTMGGYGSQITPEDRWAIVAYVRTLQFAQSAQLSAVPADKQDVLR